MTTYLITGATGFVGSHVADLAHARGITVRALARPTADLAHLKSLNAEIVPGDLTDATAVAKAVDGVDAVIHAAAKVGDWGPVEDYRRVNVEGLRTLLDAVKGKPLKRFVHVSSLGVYEARHHEGTDEGEPLPDNHIDGYTQSKVESEKLALEYVRQFQLPITILRPGFVYGPRDRSVLPRLVDRLKEKSIVYIAGGRYALNTTYVGNIAEACLLAVDNEKAVGEVFNITDGEFVTKRQFFETVADGLGLPRPKRSIPLWLARRLATWRERVFRRKNKPHPPRITQATLKFAGLNLDFSIAKARAVLGYTPRTHFAEGMAAALADFKKG
ncbi:NAD-dependent epimerase/dehydratase family protein [Limnoglobus roseus]|uniref:KR domain-containing protein n=1 Tax=Limnoglobus roseus TaxID=2598579 RepID=A0A5C1AA19_9BACT|nr:NAD-dependent epimerase/dehydratase family protein [Limnoglobus roseus]QEL16051.1 KR domain-containing protein [Limnoglobus roseus]